MTIDQNREQVQRELVGALTEALAKERTAHQETRAKLEEAIKAAVPPNQPEVK